MLPALVRDELRALTRSARQRDADGTLGANADQHLEALAARVLDPGGLTRATRHAGAEPWLTGNPRPLHERTLRRTLGVLVRLGGETALEKHLEDQVERARREHHGPVVGYVDLYDQVYWTKLPTHAGPIGGRANQLLACTYFGLTFVRLGEQGPTLGLHVSWHKPASPLHDALEALYASSTRATWLRVHLHLLVFDRGGQGAAVLQWARREHVPYLTLSNGWVYLSSQGVPTAHTAEGAPLFVRKDRRIESAAESSPHCASAPLTVVYPSRPREGSACKRGLRYRVNGALTAAEQASLAGVYKGRWAHCENQIKDHLALGFGVNRSRKLEPTRSRGEDGKLARLQAREDVLQREITELAKQPPRATVFARISTRSAKIAKLQQQQAALEQSEPRKSCRRRSGEEMFCKTLHLLVTNALLLLLAKSSLASVRRMSLSLVRELLLGVCALGVSERTRVILWVTPVADKRRRVEQRELLRLVNEHVPLRVRGLPATITLREIQKNPSI